MPRRIASRTTLENLKREAKRWLKALHAGDPDARARLQLVVPDAPPAPTLRDVQHALALEHGLTGWNALKERVNQDAAIRRYDSVVEALQLAYATGDESAMRIVWHYFGHGRSLDAMRRYVRVDLGKTEELQPGEALAITVDEARYLVARFQGFENWDALAAFAASVPPGKTTIVAKVVTAFAAVADDGVDAALKSRDWDEIFSAMETRQLKGLAAHGQMTDAVMERVARLDHITSLDLSSSRALSDSGLHHLARLPRLQHLNVSGCNITDSGLEVLRRLPALETIGLAWTGITDEGASHLAACEQLRSVDLSATLTGDGAIRALRGKSRLAEFRSGHGVTNAGLGLLRDLPVFRTWSGGEPAMALTSPGARPNFLMLRGTFTDEGMAQLAALEGLFALNVDSNQLLITGAGLVPLAGLPHLSWLAFDAKDASMPYIAALPHLRFLMCQDTSAGDDGFVALSRSQSIEHIWGRRCYNLQRRGFMALAEMPALRHLSVSCKNVDDVGLSALPRFPALRELMPMDVPDAGYRHIGRCRELDSLVLMYCRDTTDAATEHLVELPALRKYFASYTRITDRTPEILGGIDSLEEITLDSCAGLTDAGIARLARLPRLRELSAESMPRVTREITGFFAPSVRVRWAT